MKKLISSMFGILLLLSCMPPLTAFAESQSTTVRYSVQATIVYQDYDGTSATMKADVGTILKAPQPKGRAGYRFEGWKNEATGLLWDFSQPVTEHMTLTASYSESREDDGKDGQADGNTGDATRQENSTDTAVKSPKTSDSTDRIRCGGIFLLVGMAAVGWSVIDRKKKMNQERK